MLGWLWENDAEDADDDDNNYIMVTKGLYYVIPNEPEKLNINKSVKEKPN